MMGTKKIISYRDDEDSPIWEESSSRQRSKIIRAAIKDYYKNHSGKNKEQIKGVKDKNA